MIRNSDVIQEPISQNGGKLGSGLFIARYKTGQPRFDFCVSGFPCPEPFPASSVTERLAFHG